MSHTEPEMKLTLIENDPGFNDVFAEIAGVTEYRIDDNHYVNLSFLTNRVTSHADENGVPVASQVVVKKVASVTMSYDRAIALRDALVTNLKDTPDFKG